MKNEEKASFLFKELGNIDDLLIEQASDDALKHFKQRRRRAATIRLSAVLIAAVLTLFTVSALSIALIKDGHPSSTEAHEKKQVSLEDIDLFDGKNKLIYEKEGDCFTVELSSYDFSDLFVLCINNKKIAHAGTRKNRIWLANANGTVITPHLMYAPGNIGYGVLFSYEEELALSDELIQMLEDISGERFEH